MLQKTCIACDADGDCGGDYVCANFGGLGTLYDGRCTHLCETEADCEGDGVLCEEDVDAKGKPTGNKVWRIAFL